MITVCVYLVHLKAVLFCPYLSASGQPCLLVYVCWGNTLSLISGWILNREPQQVQISLGSWGSLGSVSFNRHHFCCLWNRSNFAYFEFAFCCCWEVLHLCMLTLRVIFFFSTEWCISTNTAMLYILWCESGGFCLFFVFFCAIFSRFVNTVCVSLIATCLFLVILGLAFLLSMI